VSIHVCRQSGRHLVAFERDSTFYEAILAPFCDAPCTPFYYTSGAHLHFIVDDHALVQMVAKCFRISK
jgi:hypothetical protein